MTDTPAAIWPAEEFSRLSDAEQIDISTRRHDGSLRPFVPIWVAVVDGAVYVRSYRGTGGAWFRHATTHPAGAIRVDGSQLDVTFTAADPATRQSIDAAYRTKYGRYADTYLKTMLDPAAVATTIELIPQQRSSATDGHLR